jgi:hypothetical protein
MAIVPTLYDMERHAGDNKTRRSRHKAENAASGWRVDC